MKQIIVVKPGAISPEDKTLLKEEGCVVIETANPQDIRVINQIEGFEGDGIFQAMVKTIKDTNSSTLWQSFTKNMTEFLYKK